MAMQALAGLDTEIVEQVRRGLVAEFATLSAAGAPIDTPTLYFPSDDLSSIDVATGLAYPAKADRARRNPKVGLLIEGRPGQPLISIAGLAAVRDADLQANAERYLAETAFAMAGAPPWSIARKAVWYWTRVIVQITPRVVRWWDDADAPPKVWRAPEHADAPSSDPAPSGKPSAAPAWPNEPWPEQAAQSLAQGVPGRLTLADDEGFPLPFLVRTISLREAGFELEVPRGAPWRRVGKATLSFEGRATFVGEASDDGAQVRFIVERALPVLPLARDPAQLWEPRPETLDALMQRLRHEAARRGQPIPSLPAELPPPTGGARLRMASFAAAASGTAD
ncbi:MAG: pyridoxamine 5'-phosphate oxidase family protein [Caulobacteraceae bacterium]|nr:pyridoxamine 5'-phosphate oxidase family protein [Caulobacteraceae bacterium]